MEIPDIKDKKNWGDGPWQNEPDSFEKEYKGYKYMGLRNVLGAWCGYVQIPKGNQYYDKDYKDIEDLDVHGGLTYSGSCGIPDTFWIGFDCSHYLDYSPKGEISTQIARELIPKLKELDEAYSKLLSELNKKEYRTIEFVEDQLKELIDQIERNK